MKKIIICLFVLTAGICKAQIVFADPNLKTLLVSASPDNYIASTAASWLESVTIDTNGDGEIQQSEALLITRLNFYASTGTSIGIRW